MPRLKPKATNARRVPYSGVAYNPKAARYIGTNGRFIDPLKVRAIMDSEADAAAARMVKHGDALKQAAQQFKAGTLTQDDYNGAVRAWRDNMAAEVKAVHYLNAASASGGFHNFTQVQHGALGGRLRVQFAYLSNFAIECAGNPDVVLSQAKGKRPFDERAASYSGAAIETYEAFKEDADKAAGMNWEINLEDDGAIHCKPRKGVESCDQQTAKGAVATGELVRVGRRACRQYCRCAILRFKTKEAAEAYVAQIKSLVTRSRWVSVCGCGECRDAA